ncbi:MAG: hypothetical protein ACYS6K_23580, partial [Planctomycetota bacterium]
MKVKGLKCAIIGVVVLFSLGHADAGWTDLQYPGAEQTFPLGISGDNIVGQYYEYSGQRHGFLYDGTTWTTLDFPGAKETGATDIDGANIVGHYFDYSGKSHGYLYDGTNYTTIDVDFEEAFSTGGATGIDGSNIVGYWHDTTVDKPRGFLYDGTTYTRIDFPGADHTYAFSINGGTIYGQYKNHDSVWIHHAFIYDGTTWTTLDYPGSVSTHAGGSDGYNFVGYYYESSRSDPARGFLYDGTMWTPLDYPGQLRTVLKGVDGGNIVGYYYDDSFNGHGFLYTYDMAPVDIEWIWIMTECEHVDGVVVDAYPWDFEIEVSVLKWGGLHHIDVFDPPKYPSLEALRADFPEGIYTLELRNIDNTLLTTVSLDYSGLSEPGCVDFTYPSVNGQTDVSVNPTFEWTIGLSDGDVLALGVDDVSTEEQLYGVWPESITTESWSPGPLLPSREYELDVSVSRVIDWVGPDMPTMTVEGDEFAYILTFDCHNEIMFTTESAISTLSGLVLMASDGKMG